MFERISRSFDLARSSWHVLRTDKKLVVFPVVSAIAALLVLASFVVPAVALVASGTIDVQQIQDDGRVPPWVWAATFAYYLCSYFVIIFCNSALVSCALMRFNGQETTLGDGFRAALARLP